MATRLKKLRLREISFVAAGANPGARVMLYKAHDPNDSDDRREGGGTTMTTVHDVIEKASERDPAACAEACGYAEIADVIAKKAEAIRKADPSVSIERARSVVRESYPRLAEAETLAARKEARAARKVPVRKEIGPARSKIAEAARRMMVADPTLTIERARMRVRAADPALAQQEQNEVRSGAYGNG